MRLPHRPIPGTTHVLPQLMELSRRQRHAVLATLDAGAPYASLVSFALTPEGRGLIFATARGSRKYRNLRADPRVALFLDSRANSARDYLEAETITVEGLARTVRRGARRELLAALLCRRHPALRSFVADAGTALVVVAAHQVVHVGRFQKVSVWKRGEA